MPKEKLIFECSEDFIVGEIFSHADIPSEIEDEHDPAALDQTSILEVLENAADYVDDIAFDGGPGMSDSYFKVYALDEVEFRKKLTAGLIALLKS